MKTNLINNLLEEITRENYNTWKPQYNTVFWRFYNRLSTEEQNVIAAFGMACRQLGTWKDSYDGSIKP